MKIVIQALNQRCVNLKTGELEDATFRTFQSMTAQLNVLNDVGQLQVFVGRSTNFSNWLLCNGQSFNKLTYPELAVVCPSGNVPNYPIDNQGNYTFILAKI